MKKELHIIVKCMNVSDLNPHELNPRIHPEKGSEEWTILKNSLEYDYFDPIVFNDANNKLVSGHLRTKILKDEGVERVDAVIVNYDEPTHLMRMIAANKLIGSNDVEALSKILQDYKKNEIIGLTGYSMTEIGETLGKAKISERNRNKWQDKNKGKEWDETLLKKINETYKIKVGDVVLLGEHKIACGDSTNKEVVKKLLGDEKIDMIFTDPPYGISMEGIQNDEIDQYESLLTGVLKASDDFLKDGGAFYIFHSDKVAYKLIGVINNVGWHWQPPFIVWIKNKPGFGQTDYYCKNENMAYGSKGKPAELKTSYDSDEDAKIIYGWKQGAAHQRFGYQSNIWEYDKPLSVKSHPTIKPCELIERAIINSSKAHQIVYDPFAGSGSTILACENTIRKARCIELSPLYVALCISRYVETFGGEPKII